MDQFSELASAPDSLLNGSDWSPRVSFSYNFGCLQRVPSPTKRSSLHDSEFEFSRSLDSDLLSADELFCDGKLRPLKLSSGEREWKASPRRQEVSVCNEDSISRWARKCECNAGDTEAPTSREEAISACREAERVGIGKKAADLTSPICKKEGLSSASRSMAEKEENPTAPASSLRTSRHGPACEMGRSESPTRRKEIVSVRKLEMGENGGTSRLPIVSMEASMPAFSRPEISSSKAGNEKAELCRSREEDVIMLMCKREENSELKRKVAPEIKLPTTSREGLLAACSASQMGGTRVKWREEPLRAKSNEDNEHLNALSRRFSKHPRSASMILEGSCKLGNRGCVSLNSSTCPSPSRSFSLPATTPASPSASFSGFASSSSSSYRSKIKDFFKPKKVTLTREDALPSADSSSSSTCKLPITPKSFLSFFISKESRKGSGSRSSSFKHEGPLKAQDCVCTSTKDVYGGASMDAFAKCKDFNALCQTQFNSNTHKELGITIPNNVKTPPSYHFPPSSSTLSSSSSSRAMTTTVVSTEKATKQSSTERTVGSILRTRKSHSFSHEKALGTEGSTMLVIDEGLWEEGNLKRSNNALNLHTNCPSKEGSPRIMKKGNNMMVGSKGGQHYVKAKGLERPLTYTSSVRVTPVLNVPSCITPSLRKPKPSSKPKAFSFENLNLFGKREKALVNPTLK